MSLEVPQFNALKSESNFDRFVAISADTVVPCGGAAFVVGICVSADGCFAADGVASADRGKAGRI